MSEDTKKEIYDILKYLLTHDENYTNTQYIKILDLATILNKEVLKK